MRRLAGHGLALVLMAGALLPLSARGAEAVDQWPCSRPPPAAPDQSWLWPGAHYDPSWAGDAEISALVAAVASRGLPEDQAVARIDAFGQANRDRPARLDSVASGLIDTLRSEHTQVVAGIWRFNRRQAALAQRMEAAYAKNSAADAGANVGKAPDQDADEQLKWDTRTFEDRQRELPLICRLPGVIDARLGTLLAAVQSAGGHLPGGASTYLLYVTDEQAGEVSVIDPGARREIARIDIGKRPRGLVSSPDNRFLYVAVSGSPIAGPGVDDADLPPADKAADGIAVIDLAQRKLVRTLRGVSDPERIAISRDGTLLYIASEDSGQLIVMTVEGQIVAKLDVGSEPEGVAISPDGQTVLVTSEGDNSVAIVRGGQSPHVVGRIPVGERPRTAAFLDNGHAAVPGELDASLRLIDLQTMKPERTVRLGPEDRPMSVAAIGQDTVMVTTGRGGNLLRVDLGTKQPGKAVTGAVLVGDRPWGLTFSPDGTLAFTANGPGNDIAIVDCKTMRLIGKVPVFGSPWGILAVAKTD